MINSIDRRQFLKCLGAGVAGVGLGALGPSWGNPGARAAGGFAPDVEIALTAAPGEASILPGAESAVWRYTGRLIQGEGERLVEAGDGYLGPTLRLRRGQRVRIRFENRIPEPSIVHWHGLHVPAEMDGHPRFAIPPGGVYVYEFQVVNRAGTYWYHPHPHGRTGPQVYGGLAGLLLVSDEEEAAAGLPAGEFDVPLVLQDRSFADGNRLRYLSGMAERMNGFIGDWVLVNGRPGFELPVANGAYRLRILNGSNSRIYKLAWQGGRPLTVIATDGGLIEAPVEKDYLFLAPGERVELWADFSDLARGKETALLSLPFDAGGTMGGGMGPGMMDRGMMGAGQRLPNGEGFTVMRVRASGKRGDARRLPDRLASIPPLRPEEALNLAQPSIFTLSMGHMRWTINGRIFEMEGVAPEERVRMGTAEVWEFANPRTRGMMEMPHPIHLHGQPFRVLARSGVRHSGYLDAGWKDTALLMPGERARLLVRFDDYPGLFLYHCHNLEHEDMGMMRNYRVEGAAA